jgi:opacity protein-like surface antigen
MKKILLASAALVALASSASAAQLNVGTGITFGNVLTSAGTLSAGNAAAGSLATGQTQQIGTGFSVTGPGPIGTTTAGVGASVGQAGSVSGAASIGNGAAITAGSAQVTGVGAGIGFKLP